MTNHTQNHQANIICSQIGEFQRFTQRDNELYFVSQYLDLTPTSEKDLIYLSSQCDQSNQSSNQTGNSVDQTQPIIPNVSNTKKSIFHNFQKHLISLLRKFIIINKTTFESVLPYRLWSAFIKERSYNKKSLNFVFGLNNNISIQFFAKNSQEYPEFKKIYSKITLDEISIAHKQLRDEIIIQSKFLNFDFIKQNSGIRRVQQFYLYFQRFVEDIKQGKPSIRLKKSHKHTLISNLVQK